MQELGGEHIDLDYFTTKCTHLVVGEHCSLIPRPRVRTPGSEVVSGLASFPGHV